MKRINLELIQRILLNLHEMPSTFQFILEDTSISDDEIAEVMEALRDELDD